MTDIWNIFIGRFKKNLYMIIFLFRENLKNKVIKFPFIISLYILLFIYKAIRIEKRPRQLIVLLLDFFQTMGEFLTCIKINELKYFEHMA